VEEHLESRGGTMVSRERVLWHQSWREQARRAVRALLIDAK